MFNIFDDFDKFFQKTSYWFDRPVKDQQPYTIRSCKQGFIITVNTLGISKEDLSITLTKPEGMSDKWRNLNIQGKTMIDKINFENKINLKLCIKLDRKIESLSYECKDGLTLIYLKLEPVQEIAADSVIEANLLEGGDPFDFD